MNEFLIFKAGIYPQGNVSKEQLDSFAARFNESKDEIPIFIGHRPWGSSDGDELAHGWIKTIRVDGAGKVWASDYDIDDYAKEQIALGRLKKCSVEISGGATVDDLEITGLALLGRTQPAVRATFLPQLFSKIFGAAGAEKGLTGPTAYGDEPLDREVFKSAAGGAAPSGREDSMTDAEKQEMERLRAGLSAAEGRIAAYAKKESDRAVADRTENAKKFFSDLSGAGKMAPAVADKAAAFDSTIEDETQRANFRAVFSAAGAIVGGEHLATGTDIPPAPAADGEVAEVKAFQAEKNIATFGDAAEMYYRAKRKGAQK
jgi:hypothetical protein